MISLLLILPIMNLEQVNDEQGIALIASYLRKNGYIVDLQCIRTVADFDNIDLNQYAMVGITSYHENIPYVYEMCKYIKAKSNVLICLGGYSATYYYKEILEECPEVDLIIKREGEETFLDIFNRLSRGENIYDAPGIAYLKNGVSISNIDRECISNLDELPFAAKDIYEKQKLNLVQISTSRGCLNNCSFCYSHSYFDPGGKVRWRGRTVNSVIDEIKLIKEKYEVDKIYFNNASFEDSLPFGEFVREFTKQIIDQEIDISYCANFRVNFYKFCDENLQKSLIDSGLTGVFLGIEAFNSQDLKIYNKHTKIEDNLSSIEFFEKMRVGLDIGFINFNPYSSVESLKQNEINLYRTRFLCSLNFMNRLRAYKDTPLYIKMRNESLLLENDYLNHYNYNYVNKNVGEFADFVNRIFIKEYSSISGNMYYYTMYHNQMLPHLKRTFRKNQNALNVIEAYEYQRNNILNRANEYCHFWYSELLNILESDWNEEKAKRFLTNECVQEKMQNIEGQLKAEYFILGKQLLRIDKRAIRHLK